MLWKLHKLRLCLLISVACCLAMGIAQAQPEDCVYFDDRLMLVQASKKLGIRSFHHEDFESTKENIINLKK